MNVREWNLVVTDAHARRRRGTLAFYDALPVRVAAPVAPSEFTILVAPGPARSLQAPPRTAICVPIPDRERTGDGGAPLPTKLTDLKLSRSDMAGYADGRIVTAVAGLMKPDEVFPPHSERPRFDLLALALVRAADAETVAPYVALIRRAFALHPGTDALVALEARLSPMDPKSRPPARAPGIARIRNALQRLRRDEEPACTLEVMAGDLHFLALFEDRGAILAGEALERLMADVSAAPAPRGRGQGGRSNLRLHPARRRKPGNKS